MKQTQILILISLLVSYSFGLQKKEVAKEVENATEQVTKVIEVEKPKKTNLSIFKDVIKGIKKRELPVVETTNFDSFIDEDDFNSIDDRALKIETIYPDFYQEKSKYKAVSSYKVTLSHNFYTVVVTYKLGEYEMESTLINYDLKGNVIDYQRIVYDEIAEGLIQITSRISGHAITTHHTSWNLVKKIEEQEFVINFDGTIDRTNSKRLNDTLSNFALVLSVLKELGLNPLLVKTDLIVSKTNPQTPNEVIIVIPEIVDEGEQYFALNSHIVIADNRSGEVTHQFFETSQTNDWYSDALQLREITLDTAPYRVTDDIRAFGVRVRYLGMSKVNPYESETLSLFVKSGDRLKKILDKYAVMDAFGEWDGNCFGEFRDTKNTLIMSDKKSNGFFNILIKSKIIETTNVVNENEECDAKEIITKQKSLLKYNGKEYKLNEKNTLNTTY